MRTAGILLEDSSSIVSTSMARTSIGSTTNDWSVISGEDSNCLDDVDLNEDILVKAANTILVSSSSLKSINNDENDLQWQ
ncbi:hypothetical protein HA402_005187 [Bradysia odoriphaga]|nr:hypothetical protein HA402_005187 [Bradysia odoriphaga]